MADAAPHKINLPGFEGATFTKISDSLHQPHLPQALRFANYRKAVLQSARENAAAQIQFGNDQDYWHATRTVAVYFKNQAKFYVAFDDSTDYSQNISLGRIQEELTPAELAYARDAYENELEIRAMYPFKEMHENKLFGITVVVPFEEKVRRDKECADAYHRSMTFSKEDPRIIQTLKRAEQQGRILEIPESPPAYAKYDFLPEYFFQLSTANAGRSEFRYNEFIQAVLGDVTEPYARMLHDSNFRNGLIIMYKPHDLETLIGNTNAFVKPVILHDNRIDLWRNIDSNIDCRARGVRNPTEWRR